MKSPIPAASSKRRVVAWAFGALLVLVIVASFPAVLLLLLAASIIWLVLRRRNSKNLGLSLGGSINLSNKPTPKGSIYAYQLSCLLGEDDCSFCKEMDGKVIAPNDRILPYIFSEKQPDKSHPFGYRTDVFKKLCTCQSCHCCWVEILNDEEFPPSLDMPDDLRKKITKAIQKLHNPDSPFH